MNCVGSYYCRPKTAFMGGVCKAGMLVAVLALLVGIFLYCPAKAESAIADTKKICNNPEKTKNTGSDTNKLRRFRISKVEMAVPVAVVLYATDPGSANTAAEAVFNRFNQLNKTLSDYDKNSELRRLCATAGSGRAIAVSHDLWVVLSAAVAIARQSNGAFDPTIAPVVRLWRRARRRGIMPDPQKLAEARKLVDYRLIRLDPKNKQVELLKQGMRLDLGGIAKGYALDEAQKVLVELGIKRSLIDAGGDIVMGGPPPKKSGWSIGVARLNPKAQPSRYLSLANIAIATSGDTWQHVEIDGRRYSHLVDPHTGVGLADHSSVTVIAPTAMEADALASALSVLGPEAGLKLIEDIPGAAAFIIRAPSGRIETYESCRWKRY